MAFDQKKWCEDHKESRREYARKRYLANKEQYKRAARVSELKRLYGLTHAQVDELRDKQDGHCIFCHRTRLFVDHDHTTKRIRGLLCVVHNSALAAFGDNFVGLKKALDYVAD